MTTTIERHPYQVCETCWYNRHGGGGRQPERVLGRVRDTCPCALCGRPTDSGHYMPLADREVRTEVPVVFLDGPREGDTGQTARLCTRDLDTFIAHGDDQGTPIRYACELVGGVLFGRVAAVQREDEVHGDGIVRS